MNNLLRLLAVSLVFSAVAGLACDRTPEDVERWRNAKRGMEKMEEWASSPDEPMPVRIRAIEVIIEEHNPTILDPIFKSISEGEDRQKLLVGAVKRTTEMWESNDMPTAEDRKAGEVDKEALQAAIEAKDAAYYLIPHADGDDKKKLQSILDDWLSEDWRQRNELGKTDLGQLSTRAGDKGVDGLMKWLEKTDDPSKVAKTIRKQDSDEVEDRAAEILVARAEADHPKISGSLLSALVHSESEKVIPYLKKAIRDPESSPQMVDQAMEAVKKIHGPRSASFFSDLIREQKGKLRWAAVNDLVDLRGKSGILSAATSLPIEKDTYAEPNDDSFKKDAKWFANLVTTDLIDNEDIDSLSGPLLKALDSERWPVQVLGLMKTKRADEEGLIDDRRDEVLEAVKNLTSNRSEIPGWGETKRVGQLAHDTADALEK